MNKLTLVVLMMCAILPLIYASHHEESKHQHKAHLQDHHSSHAKSRPAQPMHKGKTIVVNVEGMVCDFCARGLETIFEEYPEVSNIIVSLDQSTVTIQMVKDKDLTDETITQVINDNGISVTSIVRHDMPTSDTNEHQHKVH